MKSLADKLTKVTGEEISSVSVATAARSADVVEAVNVEQLKLYYGQRYHDPFQHLSGKWILQRWKS